MTKILFATDYSVALHGYDYNVNGWLNHGENKLVSTTDFWSWFTGHQHSVKKHCLNEERLQHSVPNFSGEKVSIN